MEFPFKYKQKIELFPEDESLKSSEFFFNELISEFSQNKAEIKNYDKNNISLISKNSLFFVKYPIKINFNNKPDNFFVAYEIDLNKLVNITFFVVLFSALFSIFSVTGYLIFAVIFIVVFYGINLFFINSFVERTILKTAGGNSFDFSGNENISSLQNEWIENPNKCSACGCELNDLILDCPDCGLKIRKNRHYVPLDTSKYQEKNIKYHFKK